MILLTERLDKAMRVAARAHEQANEHRKGTDIPYIIHPFGVMLIASWVTDNEDILIACLLHDILEDVPTEIYSRQQMITDFGDHVTAIVKNVTNDQSITNWRTRAEAYFNQLEHEASQEAIIVSCADKIHNLKSILIDYKTDKQIIWDRFTTKSGHDQLWFYQTYFDIAQKRQAPPLLYDQLVPLLRELRLIAVGEL